VEWSRSTFGRICGVQKRLTFAAPLSDLPAPEASTGWDCIQDHFLKPAARQENCASAETRRMQVAMSYGISDTGRHGRQDTVQRNAEKATDDAVTVNNDLIILATSEMTCGNTPTSISHDIRVRLWMQKPT
jgi:hypothetical protein